MKKTTIIITGMLMLNMQVSFAQISIPFPPACNCGPVAYTCGGSTTLVVEVSNPVTGKIWMDRNLGASQVATSSTDIASYGDLYQWGRLCDGHQLRTSTVTNTLSSSDNPGHSSFIVPALGMGGDWRSPSNVNLWQGVSGVNNPCPSGFRLPTESELLSEVATWSGPTTAGAFSSILKLPAAGNRANFLQDVGLKCLYWSSTVIPFTGQNSRALNVGNVANGVITDNPNRRTGCSVRCIKN